MGCGASSDYAASANPQTNVSDPGSTYTVGSAAKVPVNGVGSIDAPVTKGISLAYGSCTIPGYDPARPQRPNQDDFFCIEEFQNQAQSLFAVMDGHGQVGHDVSRYIKQKLPRNTAKLLNKSTWITVRSRTRARVPPLPCSPSNRSMLSHLGCIA